MPAGDRTGPEGFGPMTGRAAGYCAGFEVPGIRKIRVTAAEAAENEFRPRGPRRRQGLEKHVLRHRIARMGSRRMSSPWPVPATVPRPSSQRRPTKLGGPQGPGRITTAMRSRTSPAASASSRRQPATDRESEAIDAWIRDARRRRWRRTREPRWAGAGRKGGRGLGAGGTCVCPKCGGHRPPQAR